MNEEQETSKQESQLQQQRSINQTSFKFVVFLLCFINALNYVNRYTLPPVVGRLKDSFILSSTQLGLIQTCFELVYVITSPLFGYLGDRYDRRYILVSTLAIANVSGFICSFVPDGAFVTFVFFRAILASAEAAFSNIAPTLIGDMFVGKTRTLVISLFQFAIPIGCGVGYIVASLVVDAMDNWRWAFRLTPLPMLTCTVAFITFVPEPVRGEAEAAGGLHVKTSMLTDLAYIIRIRSFTLTTLGFIGVAFATGALCYWTPFLVTIMSSIRHGDGTNE